MLKQLIASGITCLVGLSIGFGAEPTRPNVLFIAVDDLRPQLACYGQSQMQTPNFDALAARSVLFERAFCMVPTCGASRASLLSGIRPAPRRFVSYTAPAILCAAGVLGSLRCRRDRVAGKQWAADRRAG